MGVFLSRLFFFLRRGGVGGQQTFLLETTAKTEEKKKELRHSHKKGGPYLLNFSQHTILRPPRLRGEKREIEHQSFSQYFKFQKTSEQFFGGNLFEKSHLPWQNVQVRVKGGSCLGVTFKCVCN
jgi:hypothetical protein